MKTRVSILHEEEEFIVIDKKAGDLTVPDRYDPGAFNIKRYFNQQFDNVFVVHRLDRDTSGVLCIAKTEAAHQNLSQQFENRTVEKTYLAIIEGNPSSDSGTIDLGIEPHPGKLGTMIVTKSGKPSITHYRVLNRFKAFSVVEIQLETGRTHQVRVHFKAIGNPLAVDPVYGKRTGFYLSEIKGRRYNLGRGKEERPLISRTTLHAHQLSFDHPTTGERVTFQSPLPKDMAAMVNQLKKWGGEK